MGRIIPFWFAAVLLVISTIPSCTKTCDSGYEGKQCNVAVNLKFSGVYTITDTALVNNSTDRRTYLLTITANTNPSAILLKNFGGTDSSLVGLVSGRSFTVDSTMAGNNKIENTSGSLSGNTLSYSYMSIDSSDTVIRYATGVK